MKQKWKSLTICAAGLVMGLFFLPLLLEKHYDHLDIILQRHKRSANVSKGTSNTSLPNGTIYETSKNSHSQLHNASHHDNTSHGTHHSAHSSRYKVATVNWDRVANPFIISVWIIFAGLAKLGFHLPVLHKVVSRIPESCLLICMGLIVGGIAYAIDPLSRIEQLLFNPDTFFLFILPPIVMEAGYFMPKEPFFANIGTILTYAIIGTVFNAMAIGASLYGVYRGGLMPGIDNYGSLTILHCLLFGSIISAVDPVAVISVFEEIHVNTVLYICVFGESLLNDGVAVVLFKMFEGYIHIGESNIIGIDIVAAIASFFVVAFGGLFIGIIFGYFGSFLTKYTVNNRIIEPTFVFVVCYLAYLSAEVFHLSGIIAIVFAAFTMSGYVEHNISSKSHTTVKYGMKMLANIAETIIFMLLGIAAVSDFWQYWNTGFVLWTLLFITLYRAIGVLVLTAMVNYVRLDKISKVDQFVMAYGGLRGAIAFSLVSLTSAELVPPIKTMICACIVAILFTSFIQGSTIRPIVEFLNVKTADHHRKTMFEDVNFRLVEHVMTGIEDIIGHHGYHYWMQRLQTFNSNYLSKWFIREPYKCRDLEILETFHRLTKREAVEAVEELERSASSGEIRHNATYGSFLLPLTRSFSHASFNAVVRDQGPTDAVIDMHAFAVHNNAKESDRTLEDTDVHHLLERSMYQPRRRESIRHRRGYIDDDSCRVRQEREILMRHKIHQKQRHKSMNRKHRHHKHRSASKHSMHTEPSPKPPSYKVFNNIREEDERMHLLSEPPYTVEQMETGPRITVTVADEDQGIVFSAAKEKKVDEDDAACASVPDNNSVAIDRELPWKSSSSVCAGISDPHSNHVRPRSEQIEMWPHLEGISEEDEAANQQPAAAEEAPTPTVIDNEKWTSMEEDQV